MLVIGVPAFWSWKGRQAHPVVSTAVSSNDAMDGAQFLRMPLAGAGVQDLFQLLRYPEGIAGPGGSLDLDLRKLRYFVAVAGALHFGRAADELHIAQPVLSRQIRALEHDLGTPLLTRDSHGVVLTEAGR
jgi:hypothetical protein